MVKKLFIYVLIFIVFFLLSLYFFKISYIPENIGRYLCETELVNLEEGYYSSISDCVDEKNGETFYYLDCDGFEICMIEGKNYSNKYFNKKGRYVGSDLMKFNGLNDYSYIKKINLKPKEECKILCSKEFNVESNKFEYKYY